MVAHFGSPGQTPLSESPPNVNPYHRRTLYGAFAATVGIVVGSMAPWADRSAIYAAGVGLEPANWRVAALILGAVSGVALLIVLFWARNPFWPRWALPLTWSVFVSGAACLTAGVISITRVMTANVAACSRFMIDQHVAACSDIPIPGVGWGLWLVGFSSAALCVTALVVAVQLTKTDHQTRRSAGKPRPGRAQDCRVTSRGVV